MAHYHKWAQQGYDVSTTPARIKVTIVAKQLWQFTITELRDIACPWGKFPRQKGPGLNEGFSRHNFAMKSFLRLLLTLLLCHSSVMAAKTNKAQANIEASQDPVNRHLIYNADYLSRFKLDQVLHRFDGNIRSKAYIADRNRSMTQLLGTKAEIFSKMISIPGWSLVPLHPSYSFFPANKAAYEYYGPGGIKSIPRVLEKPGYISFNPYKMFRAGRSPDIWDLCPELLLISSIENVDFAEMRKRLQGQNFKPLVSYFHRLFIEMSPSLRYPMEPPWQSGTKPYKLRLPTPTFNNGLGTYHPAAFTHPTWTYDDILLFLSHAVMPRFQQSPMGVSHIYVDAVFDDIFPGSKLVIIGHDCGNGWRRAIIFDDVTYKVCVKGSTMGIMTNDLSGKNGNHLLPSMQLELFPTGEEIILSALPYEYDVTHDAKIKAVALELTSIPQAAKRSDVSLTVQIPVHATTVEQMERAGLKALRAMAKKPNAFHILLHELAKTNVFVPVS